MFPVTSDSMFRAICAVLPNISKFSAGLGFVLACILAVGLPAQPIPIPSLNPPEFDGRAFDPYFQQARERNSLNDWDVFIQQSGIILATQWEQDIDADIAAQMAIPDHSDAFNSPAEYRAYLRQQLELQKQTAFASWELEANAEIEGHRNEFLSLIAARIESDAADQSTGEIEEGEVAAAAAPGIADSESYGELNKSIIEKEVRWSQNFKDSVGAGLREFAAAIDGVNRDYAEFAQSIAQRRNEFEVSLSQIESFENNVREGIRAQIQSMEGLLGSSGIFHQETCDSENECTLDPNSLNDSGAQLQALITSMRAGLDNDASLVDLSHQMRSYLETSRIEAESSRALWESRTSGTESYSAGVGLSAAVVNSGGLIESSVFTTIPEVLGLEHYYRHNDPAALASLIKQRTGQPAYRSVQIHAADGLAFTPPGSLPLQIPIISTISGQGEWYSQTGLNSLKYEHTVVAGPFGNSVYHLLESELQLSVVYSWHDQNAEANQDRWATYVADLDAILSRWTDEILPAAETWQTQRESYAASFEAWKLEAAAQQRDAFDTTVENRNRAIAARNQYIDRTDREYAEGQAVWRKIKKDLATAEAESRDLGLTVEQANESVAGIRIVASATNISSIESQKRALPDLSQEFLQRSRQDVPELERLESFRVGLAQSLAGAQNLTLSESIQGSYERERRKARRMLTDMLRENRLANSSDADVLVTLLLQRLEPDQVAELSALEHDELLRRIKSSTGLAQSSQLTVSAVEAFARLYGVEWEKTTGELIAAERADAAAAVWQIEELADGRIKARRSIKDGVAQLTGHDGTLRESYTSGTQEQLLDIATQAYTQLPTKRGLFEAWDVSEVLDDFEAGIESFYDLSKQQMADVHASMAAADRFRSHKDNQFEKDRSSQVERATIVQKAIISAMTGGSFLGGAVGYVQGQILGPIAQDFEKATGIPAGIWSGLFGGADLSNAVIGYGLGMLEEALGVPGLSSYLSQQWGKMQARAARRDAQRVRIEDGPMALMMSPLTYSNNPTIANYGRLMAGVTSPTYAWRNAEHHEDGALALKATEAVVFTALNTAGTITGIGAPLAAGITAGYYATKQAYLGSLHGGSRGAVIGFYSGAVNGALAFATKGVVSAGASYSYENGFNAQVGLNLPFAEKGGGFRAGVNLSYSERSGRTGFGTSVGYGFSGGTSIGLGLGWDGQGRYQGGAFTVGSDFDRKTPADRSGWKVGLNFDRYGFTGVSAGLTNQWQSVDQETGLVGGYSLSTGIGYNWNSDQFELTTGTHATFGDTTDHGFNSITSGADTTYTFGQGQSVSATQTITTELGVQSRQAAAINSMNQRAYLAALRDNSADPARQAELSEAIAELDEHIDRVTNYERQRLAAIFDMVSDGFLTPEQGARLAENPELAHQDADIGAAIEAAGLDENSRQGLGAVAGAVVDGISFLFGGTSDANGFIDEHDKTYRFRTCFVAGTQVHTENGLRSIEDIRTGDRVYSWAETSGEVSLQPVSELFRHAVERIHEIRFENGLLVETTWNHPFYIKDRGWVEARHLNEGDQSLLRTGGNLTIASVRETNRQAIVYNIEVDENHTYFVARDGILVHNYDKDYAALENFAIKLLGKDLGQKFYDSLYGAEDTRVKNLVGAAPPKSFTEVRTELTSAKEYGQGRDGGASQKIQSAITKIKEQGADFTFYYENELAALESRKVDITDRQEVVSDTINQKKAESKRLTAERNRLRKGADAKTPESIERIRAIDAELKDNRLSQQQLRRETVAIQKEIRLINPQVTNLKTKRAQFQKAKGWLQSNLDTRAQGNLAAAKMCYTLMQHSLLVAEGLDTRTFEQFYYDEARKGNLATDKDGVYRGIGDMLAGRSKRISNGTPFVGPLGKKKKVSQIAYAPLPESALTALNNSGRNVAIAWVDTNKTVTPPDNMRGEHYLLIVKNPEDGKWYTSDHTSSKNWRRKGDLADKEVWSRIRQITFISK